MAAPRKDDERARLYAAALKLFGEKGYSATSYQDIADACGTSRSIVQHYYPRKELFLAHFLDDHFTWVRETAQELCPKNADAIELFCMMGFVHFGQLAQKSGVDPLVSDILNNHALTEGIILRERDWIAERCPASLDKASVEDCLVVALGGAYELLAMAAKEGRTLTPEYLAQLAFVPFAVSIGYGKDRIETVIKQCSALQARQ